MTTGIFEIAIVVALAALLGIIAKAFRQPTILAYLAAGAILGYFHAFDLSHGGLLSVFSDMGVMFLLFLVGLEINYQTLKIVGKTSALIGLGQMFFTFAGALILTQALKFSPLSAFYIALALTFSSTIIVVKLLADKRDQNSLHGKISIGILLVQDAVAILSLILIAGIKETDGFVALTFFLTAVKALVLFLAMFLLSRRFFPWLFNKLARHQELLFLCSLAWVFLLAAFVSRIGLSIEIGGFLAGLALANSAEHFQIAAKFRSLRDFFILLFFVILGTSLSVSGIDQIIIAALILSAFVLVAKPFVIMLLMRANGYSKRTNFLTGISLGQVSEFSLILIALAYKSGHIGAATSSLISLVAVISIIASSYFVSHDQRLYKLLSSGLWWIEKKGHKKEKDKGRPYNRPIILVGFNRTGQSIAQALKKRDLLVIDFDPDMALKLNRERYTYLFGDISDEEVLEFLDLSKARVLISTSPDIHDNLLLLHRVKAVNPQPKFIGRAETKQEAEELYKQGADYVLMPHITSGHYLGHLVSQDPKLKVLRLLRKRDETRDNA